MEPTGSSHKEQANPQPTSRAPASSKPPPSSLGFSLDAPPLADVLEEADKMRRYELRRDLRAVALGALFALAGLAALAFVVS